MYSNTACQNRLSFFSVIFLAFFAGSMLFASSATGQTFYVNAASTASTPDGSSWASAYADLQSAVDAAETAGSGTIWVARGIYTGTDDQVLTIKKRIRLYGGFAGTEDSLDQRDWQRQVTVIHGEDTRGCVLVDKATGVILDGFTLTNGQSEYGAALYNISSSPTVTNCSFTKNNSGSGGAIFNDNCAPKITNCTFTKNNGGRGGAIYNSASSPTVTNCTFTQNNAPIFGGAIFNQSNSSPVITNCAFTKNNASSGGAIYNSTYSNSEPCTPRINSCTFTQNSASDRAGAIYSYLSSAQITNCIFTGNNASEGSVLFNLFFANPVMTNCSMTGNSASSSALIYNMGDCTPVLKNCILWGNEKGELYSLNCDENTKITYSCIQGGYTGTGNIKTNPRFVDAPYNLQLLAGSPCIDKGTKTGAPSQDILGRTRPQGAGVDMGAYEGAVAEEDLVTLTLHHEPEISGQTLPPAGSRLFIRGDTIPLQAYAKSGYVFSHWTGDLSDEENPASLTMNDNKTVTAHFVRKVYYVNAASTAENPDGSSWENAFPDLQTAVDAAYDGGEVWVAQGTYTSTLDPVLTMKEDSILYGGFAGTESTLEERDWEKHLTIIDGEDERQCVTSASDALLDGFTLKNGKASRGAGLENSFSSFTVVNCTFKNNTASYGGGIYNAASPSIINCTFLDNSSLDGGGLYNEEGVSPTVTNCTFWGNSAERGGGIHNHRYSLPVVTNCTFVKNNASANGGGIFHTEANSILTNCVFAENNAKSGGGAVFNYFSYSTVVMNCTFSNNTASQGDAICNRKSTPSLTNSILWENGLDPIYNFDDSSTTARYCCIQGGYMGQGNIENDPLFVNAPYSLQLRRGSPCVNKGTTNGAPETDILGRPRPQGPNTLGAYEGIVEKEDLLTLTIHSVPEMFGRTAPPLGNASVVRGDLIQIHAHGKYNATFSHWTGDLSGETNPSFLLMDSDKTVTAHFDEAVWYVNAASTAENPDGSSWENAYPNLQTAVDAARDAGGGSLWVAQGTYTSDSDPRHSALIMRDGVALYGGFAGTESSLDQRDWNAHPTIIDGEEIRRCVSGASEAILDGFIICNGKASIGGGLYNHYISPTIRNCTFTANKAEYGAAIYNATFGSPVVTNCIFTENQASDSGGAIYNESMTSSVITNCTFTENMAEYGGAISNDDRSSPTINNCIFTENQASVSGGAISNSDRSYPTITNCSFTENTAEYGGALHNVEKSEPSITNCILWENGPSAIYNDADSTATIRYSCVQGGYDGDGNIADNPLFIRAPSILELRTTSPCIDTGTADGAPDTDILGRIRPQGAGIDMGAYEGAVPEEDLATLTLHNEPETSGRTEPPAGSILYFRGDTVSLEAYSNPGFVFFQWTGDLSGDENPTALIMDGDKTITARFIPRVCRVNAASIAENPDGSSWENAYPDLQTAVDAVQAAGGGAVWVARGSYTSDNDPVLTMKEGVALYGGFAGTESSLDQRDWEKYPTVIDGQNTRQCVLGANDAILDGFTLSNGQADYGAGMYNSNASPIVANCTFTENTASTSGGALYNYDASPTITNCTFTKNTANWGGAIINGSSSSPDITNCTFTENTASYGGGAIHNYYSSSPEITNCTFTQNTTSNYGGAICNDNSSSPGITNCTFTENTANQYGGAIYNESSSSPGIINCNFTKNTTTNGGAIYSESSSSPEITNCTFTENTANQYGGAILNNKSSSPEITNCNFTKNTTTKGGAICNYSLSSPEITNCTFTENTANEYGGAVYNYESSSPGITNCTFTQNTASIGGVLYNEDSSSSVKNCILWENEPNPVFIDPNSTATITFSCIEGGYAGDGNIDENPLFVNAPSILQLRDDSPCVDTGTADGAPATDILGRPRPVGAGIDMGAYEGTVAEEDLVTLTLQSEPAIFGQTEPPAGSHLFIRGDTIQLQASGKIGAAFSHWTGDLSGDENPISLLMDSDKTVTAHFAPRVYHVNAASTAENPDGSSWELAYPDLQSAVDAVQAAGGGTVWVARGNYTSDKDAVLTMKERVALYGGFAGTESTLDERDWETNLTVIDGEDTRRCVIGADDAILDGFTLSNGKANAGAGMYTNNASPTVANCIFTENNASSSGGGMYNHNASPLITNCNFIKNEALYAGAMVNATSSSPEIINCTFTENKALYLGGGMAIIDSSPIVTNCNFTKNEAEQGGAMFNQDAHPEVTNCTFTENEALYDGGSMYNYHSSPEITNCSFTQNTASIGGVLYHEASSSSVKNCILWENETNPLFIDPNSAITITYSCIQGGYDGEGNIDEDPLFVNAPGDLQLSLGSPCINAGTFDDAPDTDIRGRPRPQGPGIDMGAFEFMGFHPADKNGDWRIDQQEAADYLEEWQVRDAPMRTAIQAAFIQKSGEEYEYDYNKPEPECWQPLTKP